MSIENLIFWYTGAAVWAVIAIAAAIAVLCGLYVSYRNAQHWKTWHELFAAPKEMREAVMAGIHCGSWPPGVTGAQIAKAVEQSARGMLLHYSDEDMAQRCNGLHVLDCGDTCMYLAQRCKVIGVSTYGEWRRYQIRDEDDQLVVNLCAADIEPIEQQD